MRAISFAGVLTGVLAFALTATSASGDPPANRMAYLIGTWNCSIKLPAAAGGPAGSEHGVWTFTKSQATAIHAHWVAAGYEAHDFYGYDAKAKTYWIVGIDTQGVVGSQSSKDGVDFTGSYRAGGISTPERDIITHPTATTLRDVSESETKGVWSKSAELDCTKS